MIDLGRLALQRMALQRSLTPIDSHLPEQLGIPQQISQCNHKRIHRSGLKRCTNLRIHKLGPNPSSGYQNSAPASHCLQRGQTKALGTGRRNAEEQASVAAAYGFAVQIAQKDNAFSQASVNNLGLQGLGKLLMFFLTQPRNYSTKIREVWKHLDQGPNQKIGSLAGPYAAKRPDPVVTRQ